LFRKVAVLTFAPGVPEDALLEAALEAGAEDLADTGDGGLELLAPPEALEGVRAAVTARGFEPTESEVVFRPTTSVRLTGEDAERALKLLEALEELDDVQYVHTNAEFPEELMSAAQA
ncbi:MAG TPA: YebC/PmpR family DNA-binding transcriptional regulator, partial [Acidiferrobacteraceae bacterium]|nr:YebC/PmpR family DNA-binding transcriptional regulator [Acidiferrobacteraceae bacterium]